MRILCIGDVVGNIGCEFLRKKLPLIKREKNIDLTIVNGENSSDGNGILPKTADFLFESGADVITLGNHSFHRKEIYNYLDERQNIIRPLNYPKQTTPGKGYCIVDMGYTTVAVVNMMGQEFIDTRLDNPYFTIDDLLKEIDAKIIVLDFHAEATSEKRAMGIYLDGKVSAVYGTHTHVQTGDEEILPNQTGYITDVGMTGPIHSVLGIKPEIIIKRFKNKLPERFEYGEGACKLDCVVFDIDNKSGRCNSVERYEIR